jgi:hypothetical protein
MEAAKPRKVFTRRLERFTVRRLHPSRRPPAAGSLGWGVRAPDAAQRHKRVHARLRRAMAVRC